MAHLFTYGSLMFPQVWQSIVSDPCDRAPALLDGYCRRCIADEEYPGILPAEGASVEGVVYFDLSPEAFRRLDTFEGEQYLRTTAPLLLADGTTLDAEVYVIRDAYASLLTEHAWSPERFEKIGLKRFVAEYAGFGTL